MAEAPDAGAVAGVPGVGAVAGVPGAAEVPRPRAPSAVAVRGPRVLLRHPAAVPRRGERIRRLMAGVALVLAAAAVVIGLGRLADATAQMRGEAAGRAAAVAAVSGTAPGSVRMAPGSAAIVAVGAVAPGAVTVTVAAPGTVWDVVDALEPGASGPRRAEMADRIVTVNALTTVRVAPGQVLTVPVG